MQHCGSQWGVFVDGKWVWAKDYTEAARWESEALYKKVEAKKQRGGVAILVGSQIGQYEAARRDVASTTPGQSAE